MDSCQRHPEIIRQVFLHAESAYSAWYRLRLLQIRDCYVVEKFFDSTRGRGQLAAWFRWGREDAEKIFSKIVQKKTRPNRTRVYRMCSPSTPLELFSSEH